MGRDNGGGDPDLHMKEAGLNYAKVCHNFTVTLFTVPNGSTSKGKLLSLALVTHLPKDFFCSALSFSPDPCCAKSN